MTNNRPDPRTMSDEDLCSTVEAKSDIKWDGDLSVELVRRYRALLESTKLDAIGAEVDEELGVLG